MRDSIKWYEKQGEIGSLGLVLFWKRQKGSLGLVLGLGKGKKVLWVSFRFGKKEKGSLGSVAGLGKGQGSFLGLVVVLRKGHKGSLGLGVGLGKA